jgi:putative component of membrane protein insertase Oxa1/YidC/SpoIIIJ protein YidD
MSFALAVDAAPGRLAVALIGGYKRYLSPRKGFACAHRVLHGGASCSQHVKQVIAAGGLLAGLRALRPRLRACRVAAMILRERHSRRSLSAADSRAFDEELDGAPEESAPKARREAPSMEWCGQGLQGCCSGPDLSHCCQGLDLSGCDLAAMDGGCVDGSALDCGGCG